MKHARIASTATLLKLTGLALILLFILNVVLRLSFAQFQENQWVVSFTGQMIERGFIPLAGLASLLMGFSLDDEENGGLGDRSRGLKLTAMVLSIILGAGFLAIVPWHLVTINNAFGSEMQKVAQQVTDAEAQIKTQAQQAAGQIDQEIAVYEQAVKSGQVASDQVQQAQKRIEELKKLKSDPKALEAQLAPKREEALKKVQGDRSQVETQIRSNATQSGLQIGIGGLILAFAHLAIGVVGLRKLL